GTAGAIEAAILVVHHKERTDALGWLGRPLENLADGTRSTPPGRRMVVLVSGIVARGGGTAEGRSPNNRSDPPLFGAMRVVRLRCHCWCSPSRCTAKGLPAVRGASIQTGV